MLLASAAAAMAARARREIQHRFFSADAVRPDRAIAFEPANGFERRQFERLRDRDIVREVSGRFWLDLPAYDDLIRERDARLRVALVVILLLLVGWAIFVGIAASR
jgi:hypothetical protein